jgi:hypothetical protein
MLSDCKLPHAFCSTLSVLVVLCAAAGQAHAQCPSWQTGFGLPGMDSQVLSLATFDDGSGPALYAGGSFVFAEAHALEHIGKWDGAHWSLLGTGVDGDVNSLAVYDDGTGSALYAGGNFGLVGGVSINNIAKWNGSTWSPLGSGLGIVQALAVFDDGTGPALYAGGHFTSAGGNVVNNIAKWNGSTWSPLGTGTSGTFADNRVFALAVYDDGSGPALYAGGNFTAAGGVTSPFIAKWNGSTWSNVGGGVSLDVHALAVFDDGTGPALFVGGDFQSPAAHIAKWNGTSWSNVGSGTDAGVAALTTFDDGSGTALYASGYFSYPGNRIAKWNGSAWSPLGSGTNNGASVFAMAGVSSGPASGFYAGGSFAQMGGLFASDIAKWNGSSWSVLSAGTNGLEAGGTALCAFQDATGPALFVGGAYNAGGVDTKVLARWDGTNWSAIGHGTGTGDLVVVIDALTTFNDGTGTALYAGGSFAVIDSVPAHEIAKLNGSTWVPLGSGCSNSVYSLAVFDDGSNPALYAGGVFTGAGDVGANHIAKWNGSTWSPLGSGLTGGAGITVYAMAVFDDGTGPALYVGGRFTTAGGVPASNIAKWNGTTWSALGAGTNDYVWALRVYDDGSGPALYAGGTFTQVDGAPASHIARWTGTQWTRVGSGMDGDVRALASYDDGNGTALYAGGLFSSAGAPATSRLAKWDGSAWSSVGGGVDGAVSGVGKLATFDDGNGVALYMIGGFHSVNGIESEGIAAWRGCAGNGTGTPYCFGDGTGTPCPCGNSSPIGNREGCANSLSSGGRLRASGNASLSADTLLLLGSGMTGGSALYFQGNVQLNGGLGGVWGDGLLCTGGSAIRLGTKHNTGGASHYPAPSDALLSVRGMVTTPGTRNYQIWYRDPASFCTSDTFNFTNGLQVVWSP